MGPEKFLVQSKEQMKPLLLSKIGQGKMQAEAHSSSETPSDPPSLKE